MTELIKKHKHLYVSDKGVLILTGGGQVFIPAHQMGRLVDVRNNKRRQKVSGGRKVSN